MNEVWSEVENCKKKGCSIQATPSDLIGWAINGRGYQILK